jgi:hypothetical protein
MPKTKRTFESPTLDAATQIVCSVLSSTGRGLQTGLKTELLTAVRQVAQLGIPIPPPIHEGAAAYKTASERVDQPNKVCAPESYSAADILSDDWDQRLRRHCAEAAAAGAAPTPTANRAADAVLRRLVEVCRTELPTMIDALETFFADHYDDPLAVSDKQGQSYAETQWRAETAKLFQRAHFAVLEAGPGKRAAGNIAEWHRYHLWTPRTWRTLIEQTSPDMGTHKEGLGFSVEFAPQLRLAQRIGAEIRLAHSYHEIHQRHAELQTAIGEAQWSPGRQRHRVVGV